MADRDKLSPTQAAFLKALFGEAQGNMKLACKEVTGSEDYQLLLTEELIDAIKRRSDQELQLNSARAVFILGKIMDDPESVLYADKVAKVATEVLDRAGLSKRERAGNNQTVVGVVFLPNKTPLPEPPMLETIQQTIEAPRLRLPTVESNNGISD